MIVFIQSTDGPVPSDYVSVEMMEMLSMDIDTVTVFMDRTGHRLQVFRGLGEESERLGAKDVGAVPCPGESENHAILRSLAKMTGEGDTIVFCSHTDMGGSLREAADLARLIILRGATVRLHKNPFSISDAYLELFNGDRRKAADAYANVLGYCFDPGRDRNGNRLAASEIDKKNN